MAAAPPGPKASGPALGRRLVLDIFIVYIFRHICLVIRSNQINTHSKQWGIPFLPHTLTSTQRRAWYWGCYCDTAITIHLRQETKYFRFSVQFISFYVLCFFALNTIVKPRHQTPKPQRQKLKNPKIKGPWADTKISWAMSIFQTGWMYSNFV